MTEQEFISLCDRIRGKLTALARRFNRAAGLDVESEDIVQDALATLWQLSVADYPIRDAEALAIKLTKTRCVEVYRKRHIRYEPIADRPLPGGDSATSGTERLDIDTIRRMIHKELTDSQRSLLSMRNDEGLSPDQIAAATGRPKTSIKVTLSVTRKKMTELLKKIK